jgi:hypothetical protein
MAPTVLNKAEVASGIASVGGHMLLDAAVAICALYTAASVLSWTLAQVLRRDEAFISPAIKPLDYRNEDLMLRKALNAAHWQIVKARYQGKASHSLKKIKPRYKCGTRFAAAAG